MTLPMLLDFDSLISQIETEAQEMAKVNARKRHVLFCLGVDLDVAYPDFDRLDLSKICPSRFCIDLDKHPGDSEVFQELFQDCLEKNGLNRKLNDGKILDPMVKAFVRGWFQGCQEKAG